MRRGAVYWINLEDSSPPEFGKRRPGLIISNSEQNALLPTLVVIPISSRPPEIWPLRISLDKPMPKQSFLVIPGIRQVAKERFEEPIGIVEKSVLQEVNEALRVYLSD